MAGNFDFILYFLAGAALNFTFFPLLDLRPRAAGLGMLFTIGTAALCIGFNFLLGSHAAFIFLMVGLLATIGVSLLAKKRDERTQMSFNRLSWLLIFLAIATCFLGTDFLIHTVKADSPMGRGIALTAFCLPIAFYFGSDIRQWLWQMNPLILFANNIRFCFLALLVIWKVGFWATPTIYLISAMVVTSLIAVASLKNPKKFRAYFFSNLILEVLIGGFLIYSIDLKEIGLPTEVAIGLGMLLTQVILKVFVICIAGVDFEFLFQDSLFAVTVLKYPASLSAHFDEGFRPNFLPLPTVYLAIGVLAAGLAVNAWFHWLSDSNFLNLTYLAQPLVILSLNLVFPADVYTNSSDTAAESLSG